MLNTLGQRGLFDFDENILKGNMKSDMAKKLAISNS